MREVEAATVSQNQGITEKIEKIPVEEEGQCTGRGGCKSAS
jgi:hypothetical protein